jgi:hypothetical protein
LQQTLLREWHGSSWHPHHRDGYRACKLSETALAACPSSISCTAQQIRCVSGLVHASPDECSLLQSQPAALLRAGSITWRWRCRKHSGDRRWWPRSARTGGGASDGRNVCRCERIMTPCAGVTAGRRDHLDVARMWAPFRCMSNGTRTTGRRVQLLLRHGHRSTE